MHVKKFKGSACGNMTKHYERDWAEEFGRDNVDPTKTHLNFNCCQRDVKPMDAIKQAVEHHNVISARKLRKDAVRMADIVVTLPTNVPDSDLRQFFESTTEFLQSKTGGAENCLGAFVHMDESTPHMHFSFMPLVDEKFNAKKMLNREFFQTLHDELQQFLTPILGYEPKVKDSERIMPNVDLKDVSKMKAIEQQLKDLQALQPSDEKVKQLYVLKGTLEAGGSGGLFGSGKAKTEKALEQVNKMIETEEKALKQANVVKADRTFRQEKTKYSENINHEQAKVVKKSKPKQDLEEETSLADRARQATRVSEYKEKHSYSRRRYR